MDGMVLKVIFYHEGDRKGTGFDVFGSYLPSPRLGPRNGCLKSSHSPEANMRIACPSPYLAPSRPAVPPHLLHCKKARGGETSFQGWCLKQEASPGPLPLHFLVSQKREGNEIPGRRTPWSLPFLPHGENLIMALRIPLVFNPCGEEEGES